MNNRNRALILFIVSFLLYSCSSSGDNKNSYVTIKTTLGDITIRLYDETPLHRDNFIKLINSKVYNGVLFHRVIQGFMIQTGDPETKTGYKISSSDTLTSYTIPAEIKSGFFHKKGALAAARQGNEINPEMRSSGTQFYIVQGNVYSDEGLRQAEQQINNSIKQSMFIRYMKEVSDSSKLLNQNLSESAIQEKASIKMFEALAARSEYKIPEEQRNVYKTIGGTPFLDFNYTVFGEVVSGLDVVDKIAASKTDAADKPLTDLKILDIKVFHK